VIFAVLLSLWELIVRNLDGGDTPISIVVSLSKFSEAESLLLLIGVIIFSNIMWQYIFGSFIKKEKEPTEKGFVLDLVGVLTLVVILLALGIIFNF